jgi:PAS domain S-box-containing protein
MTMTQDGSLLGFFDKSPVPMWIEDAMTARFLAVNDSAVKLYGYAREQLLGMTAATLAAPVDAQALRGVERHRKADGTIIEVRLETSPGRIDGHSARLVVVIDVSAQGETQRALHESEQLVAAGSDWWWEIDAQGRTSRLSSSAEAVLSLPPSEMLGTRITEGRGFRVTPEMGKLILLAMKARQPFRDFVYSRKGPDGRIRWFKLSATPILDKDGVYHGYRGVGAEITSHVEAEQTARLAHRSLHDAVAYVTQPFVVYDAANRAIAFNQAFTDLFKQAGSKSPVAQGVSFGELAEWQLQFGFYAESAEPPVSVDMLLEHYRSEREHAYHLRDGRWMLVVYRRLPGDGRVGLWTDITAVKRAEAERHALEAQLHHSQRLEALGTLAGGAAHEINNALVPVIALTKIVASHLPEGSRDRRNLGTVLLGAERSRDLVKQILAFSRKEESGRRREDVDLAAVLSDALQLMRAIVPTSIRLTAEIAPSPTITGDANQLHQVIVNLVANAAQAIGDAHGTITVGLHPDGGTLRLWVADTGCGMDEATKARIFEPFFTTKEVGKGTGLGLAVVHGIIKEHGGRIEVESVPGRGTRFDILLPLGLVPAGVAA